MENATRSRYKQAAIAGLFLLPVMAIAAGFQVNENSPRLMGQALAGQGSSSGDVTGIFTNPALLGSINQSTLYLGASYIAPNISVNNAKAWHDSNTWSPLPDFNPQAVSGSNHQKNVANSAAVPTLYAALPLNPHWVTGVAITSPWGLTTHYDSDSVLRFTSQKASIKTINLAPTIAFTPDKYLSVGVNFQAQYASADLANYTGLLKKNPVFGPATLPSELSGDGWGYGFGVGVLVNPNNNTHIGISYRSPIKYKLKGNATQMVNDLPFSNHCSINPQASGCNSKSTGSADLTLPAVANVSITQQITPKLTINTTEQMTFWKSFNEININMPNAYADETKVVTNWGNSMLFSLGASYKTSNKLTLRSGVAYDQTPTNDEYRDARIPDTSRYWLTVGGSYHINHRFSVDASVMHVFMNEQHIDKTERSGQHNSADGLAPIQPLEYNHVIANYAGSANVFALGFQANF